MNFIFLVFRLTFEKKNPESQPKAINSRNLLLRVYIVFFSLAVGGWWLLLYYYYSFRLFEPMPQWYGRFYWHQNKFTVSQFFNSITHSVGAWRFSFDTMHCAVIIFQQIVLLLLLLLFFVFIVMCLLQTENRQRTIVHMHINAILVHNIHTLIAWNAIKNRTE